LEFLPDGDLLQFSDTLQRLGEEEQFAAELPYFYHKKKYFNNALFEKRKKTLSVERFRNLVFHLTNGLVYLHEFKQMAHSDIKPQNILIDKNKFKFADMGLACDITNPQLCGGGTRKYQFKQGIFNNLRVSQENDVYALLKTFSMVAPSVRTHKYITDLMGDLKRNSRKGFTITARQLLTEFQRAI
jgi:serine/threonine protein kinase